MEVYFWVLESQTNRALSHLTGRTLQNVQYGGVRNTLSCIAFIKKSDLKNKVTKRNNDLRTIMSGGKASQQFKELKEILKETKQGILVLKLKIKNNHNELMERISKVEDTAWKASVFSFKMSMTLQKWMSKMIECGRTINSNKSRNQEGTGDNETASPTEGNTN